MRKAELRLAVAAALVLFDLKIGLAAEAEVPAKQAMVMQVQQAVRANNKAWLAAHARYPLNYFGSRKFVIRDKAAFVRSYPAVFGATLRSAILAQDPESVFENWQGLMIGEGRYNVWIRDAGDGDVVRYQIVAINGP